MKKRKKSAKHVILQTLIWMQDNSYEKCQKAVDLALAEPLKKRMKQIKSKP